MEVFLETDRLILRRFTPADVDDLVELDGDPAVMHFITGGRPTPREEIERETLPAFLRQRVFAETMAVNAASRRVMEKAGLKHVRTFHQPWPDPIPGDEHGDVEYALTRAESEHEQHGG